MSTPTPMKHAASQQGRTPSQLAAATPPVSTPFSNPAHAVFSPRGPRSSPQQFKKSPATSSLMAHPQNAPLNFDSPSTAAAMGALGISGALDIGLENVGVGGLGSLNALVSEDDKLKRLEAIIDILNKKKGYVSEAALQRLAQRVGLDCLAEDQTTIDGRKTRTLIIAGTAIQLDIVLDNNIVSNITLAFPESAASVTKHLERANKILLEDLQLRPNQSPLTKTLDRFAMNLERLAILDKLSIMPGLDCHEAIAGIYESLERLHQWDIGKLREEPGLTEKPNSELSVMSMCSMHGYPAMHSRGRAGLALQYWKALRLIPASDDQTKLYSETEEKVWSLQIGCAALGGVGHTPVRVSDHWISKDIVKTDPTIELVNPKKPILDWQEPANVVLPPSEENKNAGMEMLQPDLSTARVPQVMFTVTFDPPVILPQNDWIRLHTYAHVAAPQLFGFPPTFDGLFFPIPPGSPHDPSELRTISRVRDVRVFSKDGASSVKTHRNSLYIFKQIYSQETSEMPFSHPQQLIAMLPLLRQYAFISTLLDSSFGSETQNADSVAKDGKAIDGEKTSSENSTIRDELDAFMNGSSTTDPAKEGVPSSDDSLRLDVTLWVHPTPPHLQVVFPFRDSTANITLNILEDGVVAVTEQNVIPPEDSEEAARMKRKAITPAILGRALEHMEDLCKWAEWIRTRLS